MKNTPPQIEKFTQEIKAELDLGFSFTPFLGSGVSAASGLMMGREFQDYLVYAVYRCVAPRQPLGRWNLARDGWLRKPTSEQSRRAVEWLRTRFQELDANMDKKSLRPFLPCFRSERSKTERDSLRTLEQYGGEEAAWKSQIEAACRRWERPYNMDQNCNNSVKVLAESWDSIDLERSSTQEPDFVYEECVVLEKALRSLYDWKAILSFLSHLEEGEIQTSLKSIGLRFSKHQDRTIIDRFNIHITWGQKPNLAHNQIVHLARPLRIRKILTTNFDSLMEQAFAQVRLPIRVLETTVDGFLPDPALTVGSNCLIKLHGGDQQTRADFSLNEAPSELDRERFVQYLQHRRNVGKREDGCYNPSHLLLLGFSGSDWRIIDLIQEALWRIPHLKVFCVANSKRSEATFREQFDGWRENVRVFTLGRADLVLLRLYQELTLALPPGGFSSRFGQPVPAGEHAGEDVLASARTVVDVLENASSSQRFRFLKKRGSSDKLKTWIAQSQPSFKKSKSGGWTMVAQGESGQMKFFRALYEIHARKYQQTVWMEMEDSIGCNDLLAEILRLLALNKGRYQTSHVDIDRHPDCGEPGALRKWINKMLDYLDLSPSECVVFLYGRNGPGGCAQLVAEYWEKKEYSKLTTTMGVLADLGMQVYYLPFSVSRWTRNLEKEHGSDGDPGVEGRMAQVSEDRKGGDRAALYSKEYWCMKEFGQRIPKSLVHRIGSGSESKKEAPLNGVNDDEREAGTFGKMLDRIASNFLLGIDGAQSKKPWNTVSQKCKRNEFHMLNSGRPDSLWFRVQFLYACSLFRQSRHPSALISEGIFSCPFAFTDKPQDNDLIRSSVACDWVELLRTEGLFRDKPGGYLWQYRDSRLGLQAILESLRGLNLGDGAHLDFLGQRRARLHFWIGDWYRDAFQSTRHIIPIIESLYHRCASVHFAKWSKPSRLKEERDLSDIVLYRAHLIIANLIEISDLVEMCFAAVSFWKPGRVGARLFETKSIFGTMSRGDWELVLSRDAGKLREWTLTRLGVGEAELLKCQHLEHYISKIGKLVEQVRVKIDSVHGKLRMEVAGGFSAVIDPSTSTESEKLMEGVKTEVVESKFYCKKGREAISKDLSRILRHCFTIKDPATGSESDDFPQWLYIKETESGQLSASTVPLKREAREKTVSEWRKKMAATLTKSESEPYAYVALQALAEAAYARIKSIKLSSRASQISSAKRALTKDGEEVEWVNVTMICSLGLSLLRVCDTASLVERIRLRQKFLAFYGLSLGILGRFYEAHRRLNQATGLCRYLSASEGDLARVILRIRRAEVHLAEAHFLRRSEKFKSKEVQARRVAAKIDDAVVSLEAAEHLLQGLSHSSLWWGRFYSLRLRAIALSGTLVTLSENRDSKTDSRKWILSLAFRRRHDYIANVRDIFSKGILLCYGDFYRLLRTVDYTLSALSSVRLILGKEVADETLLSTLRKENPRIYGEIKDAWLELKVEESSQRGNKTEEQWCADFNTYLRELDDYWSLKSLVD